MQYESMVEALECTKCQNEITIESMNADVEKGVYLTADYPPYFRDQSTMDEHVSPDTITIWDRAPGWWTLQSLAQGLKYYRLVEDNLDLEQKNNPGIDDDLACSWAHYQVDFHIRQHYLARCGVLTLCRDTTDIQQLRQWQWQMADIDAAASDNTKAAPKGDRQTGWPDDDNREMAHQSAKWHRDGRLRRKYLKEAYAKWEAIKKQRRLEWETARKEEELKKVRELDCEASESPVPTKKRALSSTDC